VPQVKGIELVVEGRTFVQEPPTFEQEMYIMQRVIESGFDQPHITLGIDPKTADLERPVKQLIVHAYKSGTLFELLGAMMTEKGTEWSPEQASANAEIFRHTRDEKSKQQLHPALVGAVIAFFESAVSSGKTFPTSLDEMDGSSRPNHIVTKPKSKLTPSEAAEVFHSGILPSPSAKSPSTKRSLSKKSLGGKSAKG